MVLTELNLIRWIGRNRQITAILGVNACTVFFLHITICGAVLYLHKSKMKHPKFNWVTKIVPLYMYMLCFPKIYINLSVSLSTVAQKKVGVFFQKKFHVCTNQNSLLSKYVFYRYICALIAVSCCTRVIPCVVSLAHPNCLYVLTYRKIFKKCRPTCSAAPTDRVSPLITALSHGMVVLGLVLPHPIHPKSYSLVLGPVVFWEHLACRRGVDVYILVSTTHYHARTCHILINNLK